MERWYWSVGMGGALRQRAKGGLLPDHPARLEVSEGLLASVLLDSPDRSESGAPCIAEKMTSYLCTLLIVPPPDSAVKMRIQ